MLDDLGESDGVLAPGGRRLNCMGGRLSGPKISLHVELSSDGDFLNQKC